MPGLRLLRCNPSCLIGLKARPEYGPRFYVRDRRRDRDNMLTTVLDCLRDADVIVNDNIAQGNGTLVLLPAVVDQDERVTITLTTLRVINAPIGD